MLAQVNQVRVVMSKKKSSDEPLPLEAAMAELEQIIRSMEQGGGTLDDDLTGYARATELIKQCHGRLSAAEKKILLLSGVDADGNPVAEPFAETTSDLEQKQADRSRRRSASQDDSLF